jgi:hypothetical protein
MIVGLVGAAGSGKSTVALRLATHHGFVLESFAAPLKDAVAATFGWRRDLLEGDTPESRAWREQVDTWWSVRLAMPALTPRFVLQNIGTEVMRNAFHDDIWLASLQRRLHGVNGNVVVSDVRMPNEAAAITDAGGVLIRVERPGTGAGSHATETEASKIAVDAVLVNDGSFEQLYERLLGMEGVVW